MARSNHYVGRTLELLREGGWLYDRVEQVVPRTHTKRDLFGGIDYLALHPTSGRAYGLQITSGSNHAARVAKLSHEERLVRRDGSACCWTFLHELVVVSWSLRPKGGVRGARKVWTPRASILMRGAAGPWAYPHAVWCHATVTPTDLFRPIDRETTIDLREAP